MKWDGSAEGLLYLPSTEQISIVQVYEDDECVAIAADNNEETQGDGESQAREHQQLLQRRVTVEPKLEQPAESASQVGDARPDEIRKNESEGAGGRPEERKRKRKRQAKAKTKTKFVCRTQGDRRYAAVLTRFCWMWHSSTHSGRAITRPGCSCTRTPHQHQARGD